MVALALTSLKFKKVFCCGALDKELSLVTSHECETERKYRMRQEGLVLLCGYFKFFLLCHISRSKTRIRENYI